MRQTVKTILTILVTIIITWLFVWLMYMERSSKDKIARLTNDFLDNLEYNDIDACADSFCEDGSLYATVSPTLRKHCEILDYFVYFAPLVVKAGNRHFKITQIANNVWLNAAYVTFTLGTTPTPTTVTARMSFVFKGDCIYHLHSSGLPDPPAGLYGN